MTPTERAIKKSEAILAKLEDEETWEWYRDYVLWLQHRQKRYHKALAHLRQNNTNKGEATT